MLYFRLEPLLVLNPNVVHSHGQVSRELGQIGFDRSELDITIEQPQYLSQENRNRLSSFKSARSDRGLWKPDGRDGKPTYDDGTLLYVPK
jgi:hypothetical protein